MKTKIGKAGLMVGLLLTSMALMVNLTIVKASGTIYILEGGSIDPPTAPISTFDMVTYTFTADIFDSIVVLRDNIVLDGAGHTLQATEDDPYIGIDLTGRRNVTVRNMQIENFDYGIWFSESYDNSISGNSITNNHDGIRLEDSNYTIISGSRIELNIANGIFAQASSYNCINEHNTIRYNEVGINITYESVYNNINTNNIEYNNIGIGFESSSLNTIYHNNFNNTQQVYSHDSTNVWDDGYPSGGNYWSDYVERYPEASEDIGGYGIWNIPYEINADNIDQNPLMYIYLAGDVDHNLQVNILDIVLMCVSYGSVPTDVRWNPRADIARQFGVINILDVVLGAIHYGMRYIP